ncbi:patatin-like phospholipase family protein [Neorickettsia sennetsu str. Miyayama]|uniref:Patatin-like phospholipase family protein n=1 Tax=Ehrlichia sennetsu (strain ATCC VR-367 / Miyayama) TaxID=222891 RepID=Q2GCR3_EHRS3|nr:patatin-like phospholipase family protein [Neorickettsia sennetsu str. Miyayama]
MLYKNLVFKGGGVKVLYSVGAMEALEERDVLHSIERVAGVSSGAVLALLTAIGMDVKEMRDFFLEIPFAEEVDAVCLPEETNRFFEEYGRYTGDKLLGRLRDLLEEKCGSSDITFAEMHDLGFRDLYVFATDVTNKKLVQYSWEDTPDYSVVDAVRASASYPFYFVPCRGPNGELLVDGGLLDNYPLWLFDQPQFLSNPDAKYNEETLAIHIGTCEEQQTLWSHKDLVFMMQLFNDMHADTIFEKVKDLDFSQVASKADAYHDLLGYLICIFDAGKLAPPRYHHPNFAGEISIDTNFVSSNGRVLTTFDLDLSEEVRCELMDHGRKEAHKFFEKECLLGTEFCYPLGDPAQHDLLSGVGSELV